MSKHNGFKAAAIILAVGMMLVQGCLTNTTTAVPAITISALNGTESATAGTNLTFIMKVKNSQKIVDAITLTVSSQPAEWKTALSCSTVELAPGAAKGFMLLVSIPDGQAPGVQKVKVRAASTLRVGSTASKSVSVTIKKSFGNELDLVHPGSVVDVDYTGYLGDYLVFDTSVRAVGSDLSIGKDSSYKVPTDNTYKPIAFTVGLHQMIQGFDDAVVGMGVGQWKTVRVPPAAGYGVFDTVRINLTETFPMHTQVARENFSLIYGEQPIPNKVVVEPWWGWNVQVVDVTADTVSLLTLPIINSTVFPYGWETKVTDVNGSADGGVGRITVRHYPNSGGNATYENTPAEVTNLTSTYVDLMYNHVTDNPLATQDLYFSLRITKID